MRKIAILGSTGSIGTILVDIIKKDISNFDVKLLSCNSNYKLLFKQAYALNVKNLIITDKKIFLKVKRIVKYRKFKIYNNFDAFRYIFKKKIDYCMSAISGIYGLVPTCSIIQYCNNIAIANKEAIICGWLIIKKKLTQYKTNFIPIDSEHFSIFFGIKNYNQSDIEKIYLTASGGPFVNFKINELKKVSINQALKHPNWKMGKKITIDSATMMNKVFEIIEAKNLFGIDYDKLSILIHPKSYVHALIKFNNGMSKIIIHDTTMKIPIFNSLNLNNKKKIRSSKINIKKLNDLNLSNVDTDLFPSVKILNLLPKKNSLYETVIVSANDELVKLFLEKKIKFYELHKLMFKILNLKEFIKYKKLKPTSIKKILLLNQYVRFKVTKMCI